MVPADTLHELQTLARSLHPLITIETVEEERADDLLGAAAAELRLPLFEWSVTRGLRRAGGNGDPVAIQGTADPLGLLRHIETLTVTALFHVKDFTPHLTSPAVVRALRDVLRRFSTTRSTVVLTAQTIRLPDELAALAVPLRFSLPTEDEIHATMKTLLRSLRSRDRVRIAVGPDDERAMVRALAGLTLNQARQALAYAALTDGQLTREDLAALLRRKAEMVRDSGLLQYFPSEDNASELGGFARLKEWIDHAREGFSDEARALNLSAPRGVLIVGVQGCGKSLAARAIARQWGLALVKLDAGALYDRFVGESEKNLRRALSLAESMAPVVLWIDEIEKGFTAPQSADADGGVSRRLLATLLTWLQERRAAVFVAAVANDVFSLPPELLRKGRFDEIFFVDLPDAAARETIFRIHLAARRQDPAAFDVGTLAAAAEGFSGAEIEQAIVSSLYRALHRKAPLDTRQLLEEIGQTVPLSVSRREDVDRLRELARGRFVAAG